MRRSAGNKDLLKAHHASHWGFRDELLRLQTRKKSLHKSHERGKFRVMEQMEKI